MNTATAVFRYDNEPMAGLCDWENDDDLGESTGLASVAPDTRITGEKIAWMWENAKNGPVAFRNALAMSFRV
ncbi:hypothetical protein ACWGTI_26280 [Mesorhizobium sp. ArgA1]